jgi:hypothetical protein
MVLADPDSPHRFPGLNSDEWAVRRSTGHQEREEKMTQKTLLRTSIVSCVCAALVIAQTNQAPEGQASTGQAPPSAAAAAPSVTYTAPASSGAVFDDRVHWMDAKDKEVSAMLEFNGQKNVLLVTPERRKGGPPIEVPLATIDKLSYQQSSHHRIKTGAIVMLASLGVGAIVMATKSTNHWFYVDYKAPDGTAKDIVLRLDKGRYETIIDAANRITGKTVETIHAARKGKG